MSKPFGGFDNLLKPKHKAEQRKILAQNMAEAEAHRLLRLRLEGIRAKEDLYGPDALTAQDQALKEHHSGYFALKV